MKHIIQYIFCYPEGYADPERLAADPDYRPGEWGPVEEYDLRQAATVPQIGELVELDKTFWWVAGIEPYHAQDSDVQFHVVTCTQDGRMPDRRDWDDQEPKTLVFYLNGEQLVTNAEGYVEFEVGDRPWVNPQEGIVFTPTGGRPIAGYDLVIACGQAPVLVAA